MRRNKQGRGSSQQPVPLGEVVTTYLGNLLGHKFSPIAHESLDSNEGIVQLCDEHFLRCLA